MFLAWRHLCERWDGFSIGQNGANRARRGYDAGKSVKRHKRHIAVDSEGNLLTAVGRSAAIQHRAGAWVAWMRLFCRCDTIVKVFVDGGHTGTLIECAKQTFGYTVEVVQRHELHQFKILPRRCIVARTLAWLNWSRPLGKDYELRHTSTDAMI